MRVARNLLRARLAPLPLLYLCSGTEMRFEDTLSSVGTFTNGIVTFQHSTVCLCLPMSFCTAIVCFRRHFITDAEPTVSFSNCPGTRLL